MSEGTGKEVHARDWECRDCGLVYCTDEDASWRDLPDFCPECGDTPGFRNRKTGRELP